MDIERTGLYNHDHPLNDKFLVHDGVGESVGEHNFQEEILTWEAARVRKKEKIHFRMLEPEKMVWKG